MTRPRDPAEEFPWGIFKFQATRVESNPNENQNH